MLLYPFLQQYALRRMRGIWRVPVLVPLPAMVAVLGYTGIAFFQDANLWPIVLIFLAPLIAGYLALLLAVHALMSGRRS